MIPALATCGIFPERRGVHFRLFSPWKVNEAGW